MSICHRHEMSWFFYYYLICFLFQEIQTMYSSSNFSLIQYNPWKRHGFQFGWLESYPCMGFMVDFQSYSTRVWDLEWRIYENLRILPHWIVTDLVMLRSGWVNKKLKKWLWLNFNWHTVLVAATNMGSLKSRVCFANPTKQNRAIFQAWWLQQRNENEKI